MATDMIARAMAGNTKKELDNYKNNPDVADVVQNKAALEAYDTTKLTENDVIKVLDDESKNHMQTYYKWVNNDWDYHGGIGPYYTTADIDNKLLEKQNTINNDNKLDADLITDENSVHKFVTADEKTAIGRMGFLEFSQIPSSLTAEQLVEVKKPYCVIKIDKEYYLKKYRDYDDGISGSNAITFEYVNVGSGTDSVTVQNHLFLVYYDNGHVFNNGFKSGSAYTTSACDGLLNWKEDKNNKVTTLSNSSTNTQYPGAKCVYDALLNKQNTIDVDHKLDADLVTDDTSTNKFVTATEKSQITTNANAITAIKNGTTLNSFGDVENAIAGITPSHLYRMHLKIGTDYVVVGITPNIDAFEVGQTYTVYDGTYRLTSDQRTAMKKVLSSISGNETEVPLQLYGAVVNKTIRTCIELTDFSGTTQVKLDFNSTSNNVYTAGGTWTLKFTQLN